MSQNRWGRPRSAKLKARARRALPRHCAKCGSTDRLELDHIIPLAEGGQDGTLQNTQWLCHPCHQAKTQREAAAGRRRAIAQRGNLSKRYREREPHPGAL